MWQDLSHVTLLVLRIPTLRGQHGIAGNLQSSGGLKIHLMPSKTEGIETPWRKTLTDICFKGEEILPFYEVQLQKK